MRIITEKFAMIIWKGKMNKITIRNFAIWARNYRNSLKNVVTILYERVNNERAEVNSTV